MPESSYITQIINQISTAVVLPHRIDISTLILFSSVLGASHLICPALKATTSLSFRERRLVLFTATLAGLISDSPQ
jgi:hypothetical protein